MFGKLIVTVLVCIAVAFLLQTYAAQLFTKVAFTAPVIGTMSIAACIIAAIGALCMAKVSLGKH